MQATPQEKPTKKPTKKQSEQMHQSVEGVKKEELESFVKEQVINKLGKPKNLHFIRASNIFENRWRIDVWCYFDSKETIMPTKCSKIFHSYFAHTDTDGQIIYSNPEIEKEY